MNFFLLLIASLATWRLAELIALDNGPFHVFKWWRNRWRHQPLLHELFTCIYCVSGYTSLSMCLILAWRGYTPPFSWLICWPAIWGGSMAIHRSVRER